MQRAPSLFRQASKSPSRWLYGAGGVAAAGTAAAVVYGSVESSVAAEPNPLFHFGVIADVQYADVDDQLNFSKTQLRKYRGALQVLRSAMDDWLTSSETITFIANLGDTIDQQNHSLESSEKALAQVKGEFNRYDGHVCTAMGNHEYYNFGREDLEKHFGQPYYSFHPAGAEGWRFILLDSYDLNCIDTVGADDGTESAYKYLETRNPNDLRSRGTVNWSDGLEGLSKRFMPFNGAILPEQLEWLESELNAADAAGERVIVMTHVPIAPGGASPLCLLWNYEDVLATMDRHPSIALVLSGHDHRGGYVERNGVHHVTFPSPLNATEETGSLAHATLAVHDEKIVIHGKGLVAERLGEDRFVLKVAPAGGTESWGSWAGKQFPLFLTSWVK